MNTLEIQPTATIRIPVISLSMPWANWVMLGWKTIETRTHRRFASLVGRTIGIHCSKTWDKEALTKAAKYLTPEQVAQTNEFLRIGGALIGTAHVSEWRALSGRHSQAALIECSETERYGNFLQDVKTIPLIPMSGRLGIWYEEISADLIR